jgi:hypothetical protein
MYICGSWHDRVGTSSKLCHLTALSRSSPFQERSEEMTSGDLRAYDMCSAFEVEEFLECI